MAIDRQKKEAQVKELAVLLSSARLTAFAQYQGLSVKELQSLRRKAREANVVIKVIKNRLVRVAMRQIEYLKTTNTDALEGQLLYAIGTDEVAPAQILARFANEHEALQLMGGYDDTGKVLQQDEIKALASLPGKEQLRGMLAGTLSAPLSGFVNVLSGNVRSVLNVLNARAKTL